MSFSRKYAWFLPVLLTPLLSASCGEDPAQCQTSADCTGLAICRAGQCVSPTVPDIDADIDAGAGIDADPGEAFVNPCGGTAHLDGSPGGRCGPCNLDRYVCDGIDAIICDGETICPELAIITTLATDIGTTEATLNGRIQELTEPPQADHGFCFGRNRLPDHDDTCQSLGPVTARGDFSLSVDTLRAGRTYYVRAFSTDGDGNHTYANAVDLTTLAPPLETLTATTDLATQVRLSWQSIDGSTRYQVLRDGEPLGLSVEPRFVDDEAIAGSLSPVTQLTATGSPGGISLQWSPSTSSPGPIHTYTVIVEYPDAVSEPSPEVEGRLASPTVQNYQVRRDEGVWQTVATPQYADSSAPAATIIAGTASAVQVGSSIALSASGADGESGAEAFYEVRAVSGSVRSEAATATASRPIGELLYQWQASADGTPASFEDLAQASTPSAEIPGHDAGTTRHFRLRLRAAGAEEVFVDANSVMFEGPPRLSTLPAQELTTTSARLRGELTLLGHPAPTDHGLCWGTATGPALDGPGTCIRLGAATQAGPFGAEVENLDAGTLYYVRAFAESAGNAVYAPSMSFTTLPTAPQNLTASTKPDGTGIALSWSSVSGALRYDIYRDGEVIASNVSATHYDDSGALLGTAAAPAVTASTDRTSDVRVQWTTPSVGAGPLHSYRVVAVHHGGQSEPSDPATAQMTSATITGYEIEIDHGPWQSVGLTTVFTHQQAPSAAIALSEPAQASENTYLDFIRLSFDAASGVSIGDAPHVSYRVRALTTSGAGAESVLETGRRATGSATYQWLRATSSNGTYAALSGATSPLFDDATAAEGTTYSYRLEISAPGAQAVTTAPVSGMRATASRLALDEPQVHSPQEVVFIVFVESAGSPPLTELGFCWGMMEEPGFDNGATCFAIAADVPAGELIEFPYTEGGFAQGALYYVRAFAQSEAGLSYSTSRPFVIP